MSRPTRTKGRSCDGKRRYVDRIAAQAHIAAQARVGGTAWWRMSAYQCRHCSTPKHPGWHVGHKPKPRSTR